MEVTGPGNVGHGRSKYMSSVDDMNAEGIDDGPAEEMTGRRPRVRNSLREIRVVDCSKNNNKK